MDSGTNWCTCYRQGQFGSQIICRRKAEKRRPKATEEIAWPNYKTLHCTLAKTSYSNFLLRTLCSIYFNEIQRLALMHNVLASLVRNRIYSGSCTTMQLVYSLSCSFYIDVVSVASSKLFQSRDQRKLPKRRDFGRTEQQQRTCRARKSTPMRFD